MGYALSLQRCPLSDDGRQRDSSGEPPLFIASHAGPNSTPTAELSMKYGWGPSAPASQLNHLNLIPARREPCKTLLSRVSLPPQGQPDARAYGSIKGFWKEGTRDGNPQKQTAPELSSRRVSGPAWEEIKGGCLPADSLSSIVTDMAPFSELSVANVLPGKDSAALSHQRYRKRTHLD